MEKQSYIHFPFKNADCLSTAPPFLLTLFIYIEFCISPLPHSLYLSLIQRTKPLCLNWNALLHILLFHFPIFLDCLILASEKFNLYDVEEHAIISIHILLRRENWKEKRPEENGKMKENGIRLLKKEELFPIAFVEYFLYENCSKRVWFFFYYSSMVYFCSRSNFDLEHSSILFYKFENLTLNTRKGGWKGTIPAFTWHEKILRKVYVSRAQTSPRELNNIRIVSLLGFQ